MGGELIYSNQMTEIICKVKKKIIKPIKSDSIIETYGRLPLPLRGLLDHGKKCNENQGVQEFYWGSIELKSCIKIWYG